MAFEASDYFFLVYTRSINQSWVLILVAMELDGHEIVLYMFSVLTVETLNLTLDRIAKQSCWTIRIVPNAEAHVLVDSQIHDNFG